MEKVIKKSWEIFKEEQKDRLNSNDDFKICDTKNENISDTERANNAFDTIKKVASAKTYKISEEQYNDLIDRKNAIINDLIYKDEVINDNKSKLDEIVEVMHFLDWKYANSDGNGVKDWEVLKVVEDLIDEGIDKIKNQGSLYFYASTAGWTVSIDVLENTIDAYFSIYDTATVEYKR